MIGAIIAIALLLFLAGALIGAPWGGFKQAQGPYAPPPPPPPVPNHPPIPSDER